MLKELSLQYICGEESAGIYPLWDEFTMCYCALCDDPVNEEGFEDMDWPSDSRERVLGL